MRLIALGCIVLVGGTALAQPAAPGQPNSGQPAPGQPNSGQPAPGQPNPGQPPTGQPPTGEPPAPAPTDPSAPTPAPTTPAPTPAPAPITVPAPVPKSARKTATEARLSATALCTARDPSCDWIATFSSLERASIRRALAERGFIVEPAPWGKPIGRIHVHNEDVFAEKNWLRFFNLFHFTTRESYVRSELTISEGDVWDDDRIAESQRRVKDPLYTSVVALLPVQSATEGHVDVLVVTRDIWSLRLNTQYTFQERTLTNFTVSISENNFLGRRKTLALSTIVDQGAFAAGPLYIDKNWLQTEHHFDLRARVDKIFTRQSLDIVTPEGERIPTGDPRGLQDGGGLRSEGTAATVTFAKPLWSLASPWAAAGAVSYRNAVSRQYFATGLRRYDDPDTLETENLPRQYRMQTWSVRASATRQWGTRFKHQLEGGYSVSSQRPSLLQSFGDFDATLREHFIRDVFPRSEVVSNPFIEYTLFETRFKMVRNIDTFELAEDIRFGPSVVVGLLQTFKTLGSDFRFTRPSLVVGWTEPLGRDGFARVSAGGQMRIQDGRTIDNTATASTRIATPTLFGYLRFIGQAGFETRWNDTQNQFYSLGSESGLRAYRIQQFIGDRRFLAQFETRSVPFPVWVVRVGGVAFYEGGGAANSFSQMRIYHDVGFGLRMLIPQSSRELFRFDLAFPLVGAPGTPAGSPRFIAGFDSYF